MTAKQYLGQIKRINNMINNKLTEIYQLRSMVQNVGLAVNDDRVQTSSDKDKLGSAVSKIVDLEREADALIDSYLEKRSRIISQIDMMDDDMHYQVLFNRYVAQKSFESISEDVGYSVRQVQRIHGDALLAFEKKYSAYLK